MNFIFRAGSKFHEYLVDEGSTFPIYGYQYIYSFPNGYGASVIKTDFSYGGTKDLWEIAIIKFKTTEPLEYDICYDTPITDDVIGHLTDDEAGAIMEEIYNLPKI